MLKVGDNESQDTLLGLGAGDELVGKSAADQLVGGSGPDLLEGKDGNDTLIGGRGRDRIFTGGDFELVFAFDGNRGYINCNGGGRYGIVFDRRLDRLDRCPGASSARSSATSLGSDSGGPGTAVSLDQSNPARSGPKGLALSFWAAGGWAFCNLRAGAP